MSKISLLRMSQIELVYSILSCQFAGLAVFCQKLSFAQCFGACSKNGLHEILQNCVLAGLNIDGSHHARNDQIFVSVVAQVIFGGLHDNAEKLVAICILL